MDDDDDDGKEEEGERRDDGAATRADRRDPNRASSSRGGEEYWKRRRGRKILFETMDKVFASVLETSEIRARDVKRRETREKESEKGKRTGTEPRRRGFRSYRNRSVPSETGTCEVTEVVVYDFKRRG